MEARESKGIRLVAADVDGTLVDSAKRVPAGFAEAVRRLREHGIRFVIASGRQYWNVRETFGQAADDAIILPENGSMLIDGGEATYTSRITDADIEAVLDAVRGIPTAYPMLSGVKATYVRRCSAFCASEMAKYYARRVIGDDAFTQAKDDVICKIAIFDDESSAQNVWPAVSHFTERVHPVLSADNWLDFMNDGVDKGSGLRVIMDRLGVAPEECMAFGDYGNDIGMLRICGESYAMANATDDVKAVCRHIAPSNDDDGVMRVLRREFPFLNDITTTETDNARKAFGNA